MQPTPQMSQYAFDPVTQRYRFMTPTEQTKKQQQQAGLGGGNGVSPAPSTSPASMSPETAVGMQNFGMAMQGIPSIAAQVAGAIATGIPSAFGYATPSPVPAPVAPTVTPIAPTQGLAAMNAAGSGDDDGTPEGSVSIGAIGTEGLGDVGGPDSAADAGMGTGVGGVGGDAGGGDSGGGSGDGGVGGDGGDGGAGDGGGGGGGGEGEKAGGVISLKRYEQGGVASLADKVQNQGRGDDSMLVHMTPGEVAGLQYLAMRHGGSLTVNPKTGLVEAGFLENILPMLAGAALTATGVGAPLAAMMVGGGTALLTGDIQKGLFAGLGAFGGANLAGSLSAAGAATTAGQTITPQIAQQTAITAQPVVAGASPYALSAGAGPAAGMGLGTGLKTAAAAPGFGVPASMAAPVSQVAGAVTPAAAPVTFGNMASGVKALGTEAGRSAFMESAGGLKGLATKVGAPLAAGMFSAEEPSSGAAPQTYIRPYGFDYKPTAESDPNFKFRTGAKGESTAEQRYFTPTFTPMGTFKAGTEPGGSFYGTPTQEQLDLYSRPKDGNVLGLAGGGIASLRENDFILPADVISHMGNGSSDAGMEIAITEFKARPIKGDGDGMSDSIPTDIEGKQKALVANEEALIPREMVAFLGGGSVERGADKLEKFMTRVRKARTGKAKQAPEIDVSRYMPA